MATRFGNLFPMHDQHLQHLEDQLRGARRASRRASSGFREYIGESYFDYLAGLDDLVLLMDESHRYRASAGVRAINELKPMLGLELTATPFVETRSGPVPFKNVIFDYPLGKAMADGFVKEPAVVTRKNFNPGRHDPRRPSSRSSSKTASASTRTSRSSWKPTLARTGERDREAVHAGDRPRHDARRNSCIASDPVRRFLRGPLQGQGHPGRFQQDRRGRGRDDRAACSRSSTPTSRPKSSSTSTCSRKAGT